MPIRKSTRMPALVLLVALVAVAGWGCSSGVSTSGLSLVNPQGDHPSGWISAHPSSASPDGEACKLCHGDNLRGGIAGVSCFTASRGGQGCHANGPAFHPASWLDRGAGGGFHGNAFTGNVLIRNLACTDCHDPNDPTEPPGFICLDCHFDITGTQRVPAGSAYIHGRIAGHHGPGIGGDPAVNSVCSNCHETNNRFGFMPQPLCHNCHEPFPVKFHPAGWEDPGQHGVSAKALPTSTSGFSYCQDCHGTDFAGAGNAPTCLHTAGCHGSGIASPHARAPWRSSTTPKHTDTAVENAPACALCHFGEPSAGNHPPVTPPAGSDPGCFNSTLCHGVIIHEDPVWIRPLPGNHGVVANNDLTFCQNCHATPSTGGTNPRFNDTLGSLVNGCEKCHKANTAHPPVDPGKIAALPPPDNAFSPAARWYTHDEAGSFKKACTLCHGANLLGSAEGGVGPACTTCHVTTPVNLATGDPVLGCSSCHGNPPSGTAFPNIGSAHGKKNVLPGVTGVCGTCHLGAGTGTRDRHFFNGTVDVAFLPAYNAKSGAASYSAPARTCSGTSCHGGRTTPDWRQAGSIIVNTDAGCLQCHAFGTSEFNSFVSGEHDKHVNDEGIGCRECHNMALQTPGALNHFRFLSTPQMEGPASGTFQNSTGSVVYNPTAKTCTGTCHGEDHDGEDW